MNEVTIHSQFDVLGPTIMVTANFLKDDFTLYWIFCTLGEEHGIFEKYGRNAYYMLSLILNKLV